MGQRKVDTARGGTFADDEIEREILHCRVENLLYGTGQAVDLIDKENVALSKIGKQRSQIPFFLDSGTRGDVQIHTHLGGYDPGQRCFAETGRPVEQHMIERVPAQFGGVDVDLHDLLRLLLTDIFI